MLVSQYFLIFVWFLLMLLVRKTIAGADKIEYVLGEKETRSSRTFAWIAFFPVIMMTAFRGNIGDTYTYRKMFGELPSAFSELADFIPTITKDKGFYILSAIIKCIIGSSDVFYFFIVAFIQSAALVSVYRKYSTDYLMSVFLFVVSTDYLSWMFNGVRQFVAVTIVFAATKFMLEKKWIPTVLLILLASTMHQSALIMIPIVLIVQGKAWNKRTVLFLIAALIAVSSVDSFTSLLDEMMQDTQYANVVSDWTMWEDDGTNALRVLVYAVPTILSVVGIKYIQEADDPVINFCTNMSIVSTGIYIVSMFTSGIFIGRLPIYVSLYNYILLPWEIEHMFTKRSARLVKMFMIGFYMMFYWYQVVLTFGL